MKYLLTRLKLRSDCVRWMLEEHLIRRKIWNLYYTKKLNAIYVKIEFEVSFNFSPTKNTVILDIASFSSLMVLMKIQKVLTNSQRTFKIL